MFTCAMDVQRAYEEECAEEWEEVREVLSQHLKDEGMHLRPAWQATMSFEPKREKEKEDRQKRKTRTNEKKERTKGKKRKE
jgi:hypothetical protein